MGRHWNAPEIWVACKAYAKATLNSIFGADQHLDQFEKELSQWMEEFSPPNATDSTYHRRVHIYRYLRDNVFSKFQKFNKALQHIYACNPKGVTGKKNVNMAITLFNGETKGMDYAFNDYDYKNKWNLCRGWMAVKHLPKFAFNAASSPTSAPSTPSTEGDASASSGAEFCDTVMPARGVKRGRDASKMREKEEEQVKQREDGRDAQLQEMQKSMMEISATVKRRNSASIIVQALKVTTDVAQKEKLQAKLVEMALEL